MLEPVEVMGCPLLLLVACTVTGTRLFQGISSFLCWHFATRLHTMTSILQGLLFGQLGEGGPACVFFQESNAADAICGSGCLTNKFIHRDEVDQIENAFGKGACW